MVVAMNSCKPIDQVYPTPPTHLITPQTMHAGHQSYNDDHLDVPLETGVLIDMQLVEVTLQYMLKEEHTFRPNADYLGRVQGKHGIGDWMRTALIEWVSEVCGVRVGVCLLAKFCTGS